jgi:VanZ family protein
MYAGFASVLHVDCKLYRSAAIQLTQYLTCTLFPLIFGGLIEIFQPVLSNRTASWWDFVLNATGIIFSFLLFAGIRKFSDKLS